MTNGSVSFSVAQAIALETEGLKVSAPTGDFVTLSDTAANIATLTAAQIAGLEAIGVTAIVATNASVSLSVAQTSAVTTAGLSVGAPANDTVTEHNADGSYNVHYYTTGTFQGVSYASYDNAYTSSGFRDLFTVYGAGGNVLASESFATNGGYSITVGGVLTQQKTVNADGSYDIHYYATGTFQGVVYASYDNAYTSSGFRDLFTVYGAAGNVLASESFATNGGYSITIGGVLTQQKTVNADGSYDIHYYATGTFQGVSYASYDNAYTSSGFRDLFTVYGAGGNVLASESFATNGGYSITVGGVLTQQKTVNTDGSYDIVYSGITGQAYTSYQSDYNSKGVLVAQAVNDTNGAGVTTVYGNNLQISTSAGAESLTSGSDIFVYTPHTQETFSAAGTKNDVFTFGAGFGSDTISGLGAAGGNADSLNLSGLFTSYASLQSHMVASGSNTIITDAGGDTLTIVGLSPTALTAARVGF